MKKVKEIILDDLSGDIAIEYSDDSVKLGSRVLLDKNNGQTLIGVDGRKVDTRRSANKSRVATRLYSSMLANSTSADLAGYGFPGNTKLTHVLLAETEAEFDAISIIVQNTTATTLTWGNLKASSVREVPAFNTKITETLSGTFSGASTIILAAGSTVSPTYAISDPIPLSSIPRTDGGPRPLVLFTVETDTTSDGSTQIGSWYRGAGNNTTKTHDGGRVLACITLAGSVAPTGVPASSTNPDGSSAIVGFTYWSRGEKVLTVMEAGNSIVAGNTLPVANRGHLIRAVEEVSTKNNPVEYIVVGLPGQQLPAITALTQKILAIGKGGNGMQPGVVFFNPFDTNANVGANIVVGPMRAAAGRIEGIVQESGSLLILNEGLPRQSSAISSAWLNDSARQSLNSTMATDYGCIVLEQAKSLQSSSNPQLFNPEYVQVDLVHPNKTGDDVIKDLQVDVLKELV